MDVTSVERVEHVGIGFVLLEARRGSNEAVLLLCAILRSIALGPGRAVKQGSLGLIGKLTDDIVVETRLDFDGT